jgi:hypothetical protein
MARARRAIRIWQHSLKKSPQACLKRIQRMISLHLR